MCKWCTDIEGKHCSYPSYGVAPHVHDLSNGTFIGSTRALPKEEWPDNFVEDPKCPGCGVYTHCPECGDAEYEWKAFVPPDGGAEQ